MPRRSEGVLKSVSYLSDSANTENHAPPVLLNGRHISILPPRQRKY